MPIDTAELAREASRSRQGWQRIEEIARLVDIPGNRVLDIGIHGDVFPGGNFYLFHNASYETLDVDGSVLPTWVGDVRATSFPDETFDLVICHSVLEHVLEEREKAYPEIVRILKKGGVGIIVIPQTLERESEKCRQVTYGELAHCLGLLQDAEYTIDKLGEESYFVEILK